MARPDAFAFLRAGTGRWDLAALIVAVGLIAFLGDASRGLLSPLATLDAETLSLSPWKLPQYAARTTLRMFAALGLSLLFTLVYATWAARSERAGKLLVPILDVLQSVPILGFISITVVFFMSLVPGRVLGAEFAAVFAIFTSQAWNMAFSFYQSLRTVPVELTEAAISYRLTPWMRFWRLDVPFALPALIWNMMMSMSGGWFFVVASESISVGQTSVALPGIGSYIALAIARRDLHAIGWAVLTMLLVIAAYDQLVFRPLVAWADRFRVEQEEGSLPPASWALKMYQRSRFIATVQSLARTFVRWTSRRVLAPAGALVAPVAARAPAVGGDRLWLSLVIVMVALGVWHIARVLIVNTTPAEALLVIGLGCLTLLRVLVLIALASVIWVPVGVWIGMRPRATAIVQPVAQFLAAFPANLLFPMVVYFVVTWKLHPDIWLSPLMILGTQWYILFNVIAGAASIPGELRHVAQNFRVRGWLWWRRIALPAVMPFYVTGAITASGGSWNAAIVAEVARWGDTQVTAHGIGAYIAEATVAGDFHRVVLGIAVMSLFVLLINRLFWRPLYYRAERRFRLS